MVCKHCGLEFYYPDDKERTFCSESCASRGKRKQPKTFFTPITTKL